MAMQLSSTLSTRAAARPRCVQVSASLRQDAVKYVPPTPALCLSAALWPQSPCRLHSQAAGSKLQALLLDRSQGTGRRAGPADAR